MFLAKIIDYCAMLVKLIVQTFRAVHHKLGHGVNTILGYPYTTSNYYSVKSGFSVDYVAKIFIKYLHKEVVVWVGLFFIDKFLISRATKRFFSNMALQNSFLIKTSAASTEVLVSFFIFLVCLAILISFFLVYCLL